MLRTTVRSLLAALSPDVIGARIDQWQKLLEPFVEVDAHSLYGYDAFLRSFAKDENGKPAPRSLMAIIAQRRAQILADPAMQGQWPQLAEPAHTSIPEAWRLSSAALAACSSAR